MALWARDAQAFIKDNPSLVSADALERVKAAETIHGTVKESDLEEILGRDNLEAIRKKYLPDQGALS